MLPITISCPIVFSWISSMVWKSSFLRWFELLEKPEVTVNQIWVIGGLSHGVIRCFAKNLCKRCGDTWEAMLSWWSCQSPVDHSCGLLNNPNCFHRGMFKVNTKFECRFIALLAQSFWIGWSHSTHSHSTVSTAPLTTTVKSSLFTHVHSSPLALAARLHQCHTNCSCHINNSWTF